MWNFCDGLALMQVSTNYECLLSLERLSWKNRERTEAMKTFFVSKWKHQQKNSKTMLWCLPHFLCSKFVFQRIYCINWKQAHLLSCNTKIADLGKFSWPKMGVWGRSPQPLRFQSKNRRPSKKMKKKGCFWTTPNKLLQVHWAYTELHANGAW